MFKKFRSLKRGLGAALMDQESFQQVLSFERKRSDRSGRGFVLMLFDFRSLAEEGDLDAQIVEEVVPTLESAIRETDAFGWYEKPVLGLILTDFAENDAAANSRILRRIRGKLEERFDPARIGNLAVSVHRYPDNEDGNAAVDSTLYRDLIRSSRPKRASRAWKRLIDFSASLCLLVLLSPVFAVVALLVRLSSKGPALFKQERMGQFGVPFVFYKFRSMYENSDSEIHRKYVGEFITASGKNSGRNSEKDSGKNGTSGAPGAASNGSFKIVHDPRVTPVGRFLRKTSLDELPQLFNVLKGDMSLVGPRPPLRYELKDYASWHRRRILEARPGITGIWQLKGRSRTTFDEMVRMDLDYVRNSSLWMDLKIIFLTPWAVLRGRGAY